MIKKGANFLTDKQINRYEIIEILKNNIINFPKDEKILLDIISNFEEGNFSLLSPQEIQFLNTNPKEIWTDYIIFRYKFKNNPERLIKSNVPLHLLIEPVSACNLRCTMCFQIDESFSGNQNFMGMMDFELFKKIIDEAHKLGIKAITMASRGEPTLHPKLGEMLEYCTGKFYELKINTNATRLPENLIHKILKSGVTDIVFSVDSYIKKEFENIRLGAKFQEVFENIKKFKEIKEKYYPNSKCATRISGVRVNKNQNEYLFKKFWEKYVDHVVMVEMETRWDTYNNPLEIAGTNPCSYLWERMYIWYDGTCNPCDVDYKSELSVGSVKNSTIFDIWNNQRFNQLREAHKSGNRTSCFPCDRCPNF